VGTTREVAISGWIQIYLRRQLLPLSSGNSCTLNVQAAGTYKPTVSTVANP